MKKKNTHLDTERTQDERLFVYGTLLKSDGHPMGKLLREHAELLGPARLQGRLYLVETLSGTAGNERRSCYPAAVSSDDPVNMVHGELYRLTRHGALAALDAYEECSPEFPSPQEYVRERAPVELHGGKRLEAWVYFYNRVIDGLSRITSGRWQDAGVTRDEGPSRTQ